MKVTLMILSVGIMLMTCPLAQANFGGSDDFNDNSKDTSLWGDDIIEEDIGVTLTETNQAVYLIGTAEVNYECDYLRPWIKNYWSYTEDWAVQVEVNIPSVALGAGHGVGLSLEVVNLDDPEDYAFVYLLQAEYGGNYGSGRDFIAEVKTNEGTVYGPTFAATSSTNAALRLRWDASDTTLYMQYDSDGAADGFGWTTLDSENLSRDETDWDMGANSAFGVRIGAFLETVGDSSVTISQSDEVKMDNFNAVPEPATLSLLAIGGLALLRRRRIAPA
ncbi:MAG: PEP-CTERM sorting domain-containing protein [Phycisphaerae bacterium]|jgi:hypothetical protein|nr:PEP-CTERM sorting domain-containing protein [Phycisphaerae bacterium]